MALGKLKGAWTLRVMGIITLAGASLHLAAGADNSLEYGVKAAFLLNFTKFVEWPSAAFEDPGSPVQICILGNDPFGRALDEVLAGEEVSGRKVVARRITRPPAAKTCQVLFLSAETKDAARSLTEVPRDVLTVGEGDRFLRDGGMITFVIDDHRVRFDINQTAAESAGLRLSAKLLTVARSVTK